MTAASATDLTAALDAVAAETSFSGVVRVDLDGHEPVEAAYGFLDRAHGIPMTADTRIAVASGAKTFTALTVLSLVDAGTLALDTRVRDHLGSDLPLVDDDVTVEQLLCHRSGIGDYLDESLLESTTDHVLDVPVHTLDTAESYLAVLDGVPQVFAPGTDVAYCNGGYCVLAIVAERAAGRPFHDLVRGLVVERADLGRTAYLRSDELPGDAAVGYLDAAAPRTNVLHLPVVGGGDGGIFTTAGDVVRLWRALEEGRLIAPEARAEMLRARSADPHAFALGVRRRGDAALMTGSDAGASFRSVHVPGRVTFSVLSNTTDGAWPVVGLLDGLLCGTGSTR